MFEKIARTVPDQWTSHVYGVRMEYPLDEHISLSCTGQHGRTTQDNFDTCLSELGDYLTLYFMAWIVEDEKLRISFYTSK